MGASKCVLALDAFCIVVLLDGQGGGSLSSDLHGYFDADMAYNSAIDGLEALILAHACAGIDVNTPAYLEGIDAAVTAISNNLG